jgi:hypothetical protein
MSQSPSSAPATADAALKFGGIVPPPSAKVLGVQHDKGMDERYRVVLSVDPGEAGTLLSASGFTAPLTPDAGPFQASVDGFDLTKATDVVSAEDSLPPSGDRGHTVFRQVAVDRSDPAKSIVHLWMFTT